MNLGQLRWSAPMRTCAFAVQMAKTGTIAPVSTVDDDAEIPLKSDRDCDRQMLDSHWIRQFLCYSRGSTVSWADMDLPIPDGKPPQGSRRRAFSRPHQGAGG